MAKRKTSKKKNLYTVADVCSAMEAWAPEGYAFPDDSVGLEIGDPSVVVQRVMAVLTVTEEAYKAARRLHANMLVSHHPLFYRPVRIFRMDDSATRLRVEIAAANMACYAAHTNLDLAPGGVNDILAERLGLTEVIPLFGASHARQVKLISFIPESHLDSVRDAICAAGAGIIGDYTHCTFNTAGIGTFLPGEETDPFLGRKGQVNEEPERRLEVIVPRAKLQTVLTALFRSHPYEEIAYDVVLLENADASIGLGRRGILPSLLSLEDFAENVRTALEASHVRVVGSMVDPVRLVAVLGGSGGGEINSIPNDIDVFVTGDIRYHDALNAADKGLAVIDAGHAATEKWIVQEMAQRLKKRLPGLRVSTYNEPELFQLINDK